MYSSLFKGQNQPALPTVKMLDIHEALAIVDLAVISLVTVGPIWQFFLRYITPDPRPRRRYVIRRCMVDDLSTDLGSLRFVRLLRSATTYVEEVVRPRLAETLTSLRKEKWHLAFGPSQQYCYYARNNSLCLRNFTLPTSLMPTINTTLNLPPCQRVSVRSKSVYWGLNPLVLGSINCAMPALCKKWR